MADGISFRMDASRFHKGIKLRQARMPRAAMWSVRQTGRVTARAAKAKAPVLKGGGLSHAQLQRFRRAGVDVSGYYKSATGAAPIPGLLKASIRPSRRLTRHGAGEFSLKVGPRGDRVHLYAQKAEARTGFMAAGEAAARGQMQRIAKEAFDRVWKE